MKNILLSITLLLLIKSSLFSMFVIGRHTPEGFVPLGEENGELRSKIYQTLMTYQYPMNLILPEANYGTLFEPVANGEQDFLRNKLQKISPDLDIAYISTTLWELYALATLWEEFHENISSNNLENAQKIIKIMPTDFIYDKMNNPNSTRKDVQDVYHRMNFAPHVSRL